PTDVRGAPEQVLLLQVEDVLHRRRDANQIPSRRMLDPLRLPRRARRVQEEQRVRGVHRLRRTFRVRLRDELVPPMVAPLLHGDLGARATEDDHMPDYVEVRNRLVHNLLQREDRPATIAALRGPLRCRSRQFADMFSFPPTNHFAKGGSHSRTFDQGAIQASPFAIRAQKASGSFAASSRNESSRSTAAFRKAAGGGYRSFSFRRLSMVALETTTPDHPRPD